VFWAQGGCSTGSFGYKTGYKTVDPKFAQDSESGLKSAQSPAGKRGTSAPSSISASPSPSCAAPSMCVSPASVTITRSVAAVASLRTGCFAHPLLLFALS
jgi:hypothetical protein